MEGVKVAGIAVKVGSPCSRVIGRAVAWRVSFRAGSNAKAGFLPSNKLKERLPRISKADTMIAPNPRSTCAQGFSDCIKIPYPSFMGSNKLNVAPRPGSLSTRIRPPKDSTSDFTLESDVPFESPV